jgi:large subunit ribosomal protein L10
MAITKAKKEQIFKTLEEKFSQSKSAVFYDYTGLSVPKTQALRKSLKEAGSDSMVVKKKILKKFLDQNGKEGFELSSHQGSLAILFNMEDEVSGVKVLYDFAKNNELIKPSGGILENKIIGKEKVDVLSTVPSREELIIKFMQCLNGPTYGVAACMNNVTSSLVRVISAVSEKQSN